MDKKIKSFLQNASKKDIDRYHKLNKKIIQYGGPSDKGRGRGRGRINILKNAMGVKSHKELKFDEDPKGVRTQKELQNIGKILDIDQYGEDFLKKFKKLPIGIFVTFNNPKNSNDILVKYNSKKYKIKCEDNKCKVVNTNTNINSKNYNEESISIKLYNKYYEHSNNTNLLTIICDRNGTCEIMDNSDKIGLKNINWAEANIFYAEVLKKPEVDPDINWGTGNVPHNNNW